MHDPLSGTDEQRTVILGVAASDSHAVANHLISHSLREYGFTVVNLGTCTPIEEFAVAYAQHPEAEAVLIGSLNGHAHEDLRDLPLARSTGRLPCPVILGGNLSVGSQKSETSIARLYALGVDRILRDPAQIPATLDELRAAREQRPRPGARQPIAAAAAAAA